jgi:hypothetical protein
MRHVTIQVLEVYSYFVSNLLPRRTTTNSVVVKRKIVTMTNGEEMRQQVEKKIDFCVIRNKYITCIGH